MGSLALVRYATLFKGMVFLKGFCTTLFPIKRVGDVILWHLLFNENGSYISYVDPRVRSILGTHTERIALFEIEGERHVLGWCTEAKNYTGIHHLKAVDPKISSANKVFTGAPDANYSIQWSGLKHPQSGCALEKLSISGGKFITGGVSFAIGKKDKPVHLKSRDDYIRLLGYMGKKYVVLFDQNNRRAWLVDGLSALLHLLRASVWSDKTGRFNSLSLFDPKLLEEAADLHTGFEAAKNFLTNDNNLKTKLFAKLGESGEEETTAQSTVTTKKDYVRIEDRVERIAHILEQLFAYQADVATEDGISFRPTTAVLHQVQIDYSPM
ncbi:hypothetical protein MMC28_011563 [Mycoblastus sanguinarius]|nr:hypothetical protein [Mycoblastus sanguinarius]